MKFRSPPGHFHHEPPLLVSGYCKTELRFPYLKAATREVLGMTTTSVPSEQVFSHAGELYSKKRANLGEGYESLLFTCLLQ